MRTWHTAVFFDRHARCTTEFLQLVTTAMLNTGLVTHNPARSLILGFYVHDDDYHDFEVKDLSEAFAIIVKNGGGGLALWHPGRELRMDLNMYPCATSYPAADVDDAYMQYGWLSMSVDSTYLLDVTGRVARERFMRVFRWSQLLASTANAAYGWGDLDRSGELYTTVRASDLASHRIPRVSWWSYYGKAFVELGGKERLYSAGAGWAAWDSAGAEAGFIVILHPPQLPTTANSQEGTSVGLRS